MKLLVNGSTVSEIVKRKFVQEEKISLKTSFDNDEVSATMEEIRLFDKALAHIKKNKSMYLKLVILLALTLDRSALTSFAATASFDKNLTIIWDKIKVLLFSAAKFSCMGLGIKEMAICFIDGGNIKEASYAGMNYWLGYIFLQLYPSLYTLVEGLEF